jgi:serine protease Do
MQRFIAHSWSRPNLSGRAAAARAVTALALISCGIAAPQFSSSASADDVRGIYGRETPVVLAIRRCSNAVVNIHGQKTVRPTAAAMAGAEATRQVNGMGTGVVIDSRGYVITNYHVVEDVEEVRITLADGTGTTADVIATDIRSDLALLKVKVDRPLEVIPRGTSSDLMVGEPVIAIGNAFGYVHTATEGIISALHRDVPVNDTQEYRDLIQTSAGINPGNSGGPLLNIDGQIIGVNVAVRVGAQQIAFAIPIDQAIDIINEMISTHNEERLALGMTAEGGPRVGDGVKIAHVAAGGTAARDGLKVGDRIVRVGSTATQDRLAFGLAMIEAEPGQALPIVVEREGQTIELAMTIEPPTYNTEDAQYLAWSAIGVRLQPVPRTAMQRINAKARQNYRGGLYVTEVRKGSPAETYGLRVGDVLIGLHGWSTASIAELQGILLKVSQQDQLQGKFVIIRSDQPMYGYLKLAELPTIKKR